MKTGNSVSEQSNVTIVSVDLGRWTATEIPAALVQAVRAEVDASGLQAGLRGSWVRGFGGDLHIHLSSLNGDFADEDAVDVSARIGLQGGLKGLEHALAAGLAGPEAAEVFSLAPEAQREALGVRLLNFPYTERGAEPVFVAKALDGAWGFFNRSLFNLFFNPDKGSGRRIEANDYLGVVESIEDLAAGRDRIRTYEFGPGQLNELVALIADAEQWRLSQVYAVRGRFAEGALRDEPAALVGGSINPILIGRSQSGLPAIGEFTQAAGEFHFGPGGRGGEYRVGLVPVDFPGSRALRSGEGAARIVAYAYQSYDRGRIPSDTDVVDVFDQNRPETRCLQRDAAELIRHMAGHGEFEPYLNPQASESRAADLAGQLSGRLEDIPDEDPLIAGANQRARFTISDIKADGGGKVGHTTPPNHFRFVAKASLQEATELGLISSTSEIIEVGDDEHLLMTHSRGADDNAVHLFAYRTFFRQVWVASTLGYKWYGLGQDLVGDASAGRATEELAHLTDRFLELLADHLPDAERAQLGVLEKAYRDWKAGLVEAGEPEPVFSGNVSGQGPGFAELPLNRTQRVGLLSIDKAGPSAFNLPVWWSLNHARTSGSLQRHLESIGGVGAVLEVWDVEHHRRIFLDLATEAGHCQTLLGAVEKFNVKRVWSRNGAFDPAQPHQCLDEVLLSASTEKLAVISGGEYLGKDDPVLLSVEPLAEGLNLFMRDHFYMTQGDGRGSHYMFPTPLSFRDAIATISSRGVAVSAWIQLDESGRMTEFRDMFADPSFEAAQERAYRVNKAIWDAQGGNFIPVGVGASKVESSYPLAKTLARITRPDSEFASSRGQDLVLARS